MTRSAAPRVSACTKIRSGPRAAVAMVRPPATLPTSVLVRIETSWPGDLTVSLGPGARGREPGTAAPDIGRAHRLTVPCILLTAGGDRVTKRERPCAKEGEKNGPVAPEPHVPAGWRTAERRPCTVCGEPGQPVPHGPGVLSPKDGPGRRCGRRHDVTSHRRRLGIRRRLPRGGGRGVRGTTSRAGSSDVPFLARAGAAGEQREGLLCLGQSLTVAG